MTKEERTEIIQEIGNLEDRVEAAKAKYQIYGVGNGATNLSEKMFVTLCRGGELKYEWSDTTLHLKCEQEGRKFTTVIG